MAQLQEIQKKIDNVRQLHSVVRTMKSMAAVNVHHFQQAAGSIVDYNRTVETGLRIILQEASEEQLRDLAASGPRLGAIVFGSAHGMVGQFNQNVAAYAVGALGRMDAAAGGRTVLALEERVTGSLEGLGQRVDETRPISGSLADITGMLQGLLETISEWRERRGIERVVLFYNRPASRATYDPAAHILLPIETDRLRAMRERQRGDRDAGAARSATLPFRTMDWQALFAALIRQFIFVSLYRVFVESLASENSSRLAAMQSAESNVEDRLDDLQARYHRERQTSITAELLDIVSGFETLK